jgi:hypothetical protein
MTNTHVTIQVSLRGAVFGDEAIPNVHVTWRSGASFACTVKKRVAMKEVNRFCQNLHAHNGFCVRQLLEHCLFSGAAGS